MIEIGKISNIDIKKISLKIKDDFFKPVSQYNTTIFICGGDINRTDTIRNKVALALKNWALGGYVLIYPEDIFDDLLYSPHGKDLLSLENMLADSVDVVLIIPESAGSLTELGAFANNEGLRHKIVCLIDEIFKKDKSFINKGPVKLIKETNKQGVIYINPKDIGKDFQKIRASISKIKKNSGKIKDEIGLLQLDKFLLPAIYLLEPVSKEILIECVASINEKETNKIQATSVALATLVKNKTVELTTNGYILTKLGLENFLDLRKTRSKVKSNEERLALDNVRLEILNLKYRNKKLKI